MILLYFFHGLAFEGLGLATYLQLRREGDFPLKRQLPWLSAFGFVGGMAGWVDMFLASGSLQGFSEILGVLRVVLHLLSGLLLLRFGWGMLAHLNPLPAWTIFIPGVLIVPIAFVFTYAATTFTTPSPIEIPVEIWTRYLLYLPGSLLAGVGFLRQWSIQRRLELFDVSKLMLGAGIAFLFEAIVVGLIVPAAPYSPASYYNYDRVYLNAFTGENIQSLHPFGLDYQSVLNVTGLPIEIWRLLSALVVTYFVIRALDVFEAMRKRQVQALRDERNRAQREAIDFQVSARTNAERWSYALVNISRRIAGLNRADDILLYILENVQQLLGANFVGIALVNQEQAQPELRAYASETGAAMLTDRSIAITNPKLLDVQANAYLFRSLGDEPVELFDGVCFFESQKAHALAAVPAKLDNQPIGVLWVTRSEPKLFSDTDLIWLESMSDQIEIAIQHGLMTSQIQSLSIIEERGRIAREMHDGLAQVLGYLNLQVQALESYLMQGKSQRLRDELQQMRDAIQTANADVRENILSLRTTLADEKDLQAAVHEYLEEFSIQTGVKTEFEYLVTDELNLSSVAEVQLVCLLQEALTNVRKHASARKVLVTITRRVIDGRDSIHASIVDDGVGFALKGSKRSFGLQTMLERAESVGGRLTIHSAQGKGTTVECSLPCLEHERLQRQNVLMQ